MRTIAKAPGGNPSDSATAGVAVFAFCVLLALAPTTASGATMTTVLDIPARGVTQRILHFGWRHAHPAPRSFAGGPFDA